MTEAIFDFTPEQIAECEAFAKSQAEWTAEQYRLGTEWARRDAGHAPPCPDCHGTGFASYGPDAQDEVQTHEIACLACESDGLSP